MVLHEALTGATPFQGDTPRGFLAQKLDTPRETRAPAQFPAADSPRTLTEIIASLIEPEPADRPPSAAAVAALLGRIG
jgi:hypothetical protein